MDSSAALTQTSTTAWSLAKTGTVNTVNQTVNWNIVASEGSTESGILIVDGAVTVVNNGSAGATIGNIVVNLQTRFGNKWQTLSSAVADATSGDAATSANISPTASSEGLGTFTENAASGQLRFMDASNNSVFSLVPEVTVAPGASVNLLFSASFDNEVLTLPDGAAVRAEVIVSFGNSGPGPGSTPNVDIDGNGAIDADESYVRSVATRLGLTVPAQTPSNLIVTLTDSAQDITTTGTVAFANPVINIGSTSGTVTVNYNGGASGGTITNCAHLTGTGQSTIPGLDLEACDTQVIGPQTCTPGTPGCGWQNGNLISYTQVAWGDPASAAGQLLTSSFNVVYAATSALLVGIPGASGFSMIFTTATAILNYTHSLARSVRSTPIC